MADPPSSDKSTSTKMRRLDFPEKTCRFKYTTTELQLALEEIPKEIYYQEELISRAEEYKKIKVHGNIEPDRYKKLLHYVSSKMSRFDLFGHIYFAKGFVKPGQVTTRFELSLGLMGILMEQLEKDGHQISYGYEEHEVILMPHFDIVQMPDVDLKSEFLTRMANRPFPPSKPLAYLKWLYTHLGPTLDFIFNLKLSGPRMLPPTPAITPTKHFLRVMRLGAKGKEVVYVDELRLAVGRLVTVKFPASPKLKFRWPNQYFSAKYLDYALRLFGLSRDQFELILTVTDEREPNNYCFSQGPNAENVIPAECCFFRIAKDLTRLEIGKDDEQIGDLFDCYNKLLENGQVLPYTVRYFAYGEKIRPNYKTLKEFIERRGRGGTVYVAGPTTKTSTTSTNKSTCKGKAKLHELNLKRKLNYKIPLEAISKIPVDCKGLVMNVMDTYPKFALLLHEQGFCEPGIFCYADLFKMDAIIFKCGENDELMKKRIKFALLHDNGTNDNARRKFLGSVDEHLVRIHAPEPAESNEKRPETGVKSNLGMVKSASIADISDELKNMEIIDEADLVVIKDGDICAQHKCADPKCSDQPWLSSQHSDSSSTSSLLSVHHPEGTEKATSESEKASTSHECDDDCIPSLRDNYHASIDNSIQQIQEEQDGKMAKLVKQVANLEKQLKESRDTVEKQRTSIKEWKSKYEEFEKEQKGIQVQLKGDIKRITAEKSKIEDNYQNLRTQKALSNPEAIHIEHKKAMEKVMNETQSYKILLKNKEKEIEAFQRKLQEQEQENQKLKDTNAELVDSITTNKEVVALKFKYKDLESELAISHRESSSKDEKICHLVRQLHKEEKHTYSIKHRVDKLDKALHEKEVLIELKEILEEHAPPSVTAAVRRIEKLQKLLDASKADEPLFNHSLRRLRAYEVVEDPVNYFSVIQAYKEYEDARAAKILYESELTSAIEEIKVSPEHYFMMENVMTNQKKKPVFSVATAKRMQQLHELMEKQMQEDFINHSRHHKNSESNGHPNKKKNF
ncbi:unnamed protein product [Caenorhabditis brenneri]